MSINTATQILLSRKLSSRLPQLGGFCCLADTRTSFLKSHFRLQWLAPPTKTQTRWTFHESRTRPCSDQSLPLRKCCRLAIPTHGNPIFSQMRTGTMRRNDSRIHSNQRFSRVRRRTQLTEKFWVASLRAPKLSSGKMRLSMPLAHRMNSLPDHKVLSWTTNRFQGTNLWQRSSTVPLQRSSKTTSEMEPLWLPMSIGSTLTPVPLKLTHLWRQLALTANLLSTKTSSQASLVAATSSRRQSKSTEASPRSPTAQMLPGQRKRHSPIPTTN